jgi:hypothetical protein
MRVIARVHHAASDLGTTPQPTAATSFTQAGIANFGVANFTKSGEALTSHEADLCGGELEGDVIALFGHDLSTRSCGPNHLPTASGIKLNAMDTGTKWYR